MDRILAVFLERQEKDACALNAESDLVEVTPMEPTPCQKYLVRYGCTGLVRTPEGVQEANDFRIGVYFPLDYMQRASAPECLTFLWPVSAWQPAVRFPFICPGVLTPGTPLLEIIEQCGEILSFKKVTMAEGQALNRQACSWARRNKQRFPIDARPLRRAAVRYRAENAENGGMPATNEPAGEES